MSRFIKPKRSGSTLSYVFNWSLAANGDEGWLELADGQTIATSTWTATTGITIDSSSNTTVLTTVWVSGGTVGETYKLTNTITTNDAIPLTDSRELYIEVI
jgi:hypothetical protein